MNGAPALIGRYVVERELGSGGMGEVYLAYSPAGDPVVVKVIRSDRLDPHTRARFEREALIARTVVGQTGWPDFWTLILMLTGLGRDPF